MRHALPLLGVLLCTLFAAPRGRTADPAPTPPPGLTYRWAKAYHIPPETTTEESGYFSLCEGRDGKIYIGSAAYGRNSYLVEFDPATEQMRVVVDVHQVVGLPLEPTGYAAQSKIHTRNYVGPSGTIYFGTKQGYPTAAEKASGQLATYRGGYVLAYDPATGKTTNFGLPMPLGDPRLPKDGKAVGASSDAEGEGIIDVVADEPRGLLYAITCEHEYWLRYDRAKPDQGWQALGPILNGQPNTLIDAQGRATALTHDLQIARCQPDTAVVSISPLLIDGQPLRQVVGDKAIAPDWRLAADGRTAYLQFLNDTRLFQVDLGGESGQPVTGRSVGERLRGTRPDSRGSLSIAPDGRVYSAIRVDNATGFGKGYLHHLVRYDPTAGTMADLGVFAVSNPDFFDFTGPQALNPDGSKRPRHGFHRLPDGTLTPLHVILAMIVAHDGTIYATTLYPFTLLRVAAPTASTPAP
jgi:hypothetical protein